jgi:hypothetical protein
MAQVVTIAANDRISNILKEKRGVKGQELNTWLSKIRTLNPHISDPDRVFPGERVLIPDSLIETVSRQQIWSNAFSHVPPKLMRSIHGHSALYISSDAETIDSLALRMFEGTPFSAMRLSAKRALLIHNNPDMEYYLATNRLPAVSTFNISPVWLSEFDMAHWQREKPYMGAYMGRFDPTLTEFYQQSGPDAALLLAQAVQSLKAMGASVGSNDIMRGVGYGVGGWSGLAASNAQSLSSVNALAHELYTEALQIFGKEVVDSKKAHHLEQVQHFLKAHPKYHRLMNFLKNLPEHLLPEGRRLPNSSAAVNSALARHMRSQFFLADLKPGLANRMGTIATGLNGKLAIAKSLGRATTWYIPAILGVASVASAPPQKKARTVIEEGFGIVGGALGTWAGAELIGAGIASFFCLGPLGAFVVVFLLGAGMGIALAEGGKWFGGATYDASDRFGERIYYSLDEVLGNIK